MLTPLADTDELIWYSERTGWAHLYLYDLKTGALKNAITSGDWRVHDIVTFRQNKPNLIHSSGWTNSGAKPLLSRVGVESISTVVR